MLFRSVSGYRGSPLGMLDEALWKAKPQLEKHHVKFVPGVNEDLAATAVWGTQTVGLIGPTRYDGVFAMWYAKGPGVDRCGDVFKHMNHAGTAQHGGVLLVAGEHPKFVSNGYLAECVATLHRETPSVSLEVGPMETPEYAPLVQAGADGLVVYQETYDRVIYERMHTAGPKRNFDWRLETPERAYAAGFRRLGIGALYGLADWRREAIAVAAHALYLLRHCWKAQVTISLPRLRPCAGEFQPLTTMSDRELVQLVAAFRLLLPDVGLVLSTREPARLRDGLFPLGITLASAGSHTEPGGYTGAGRENIHRTERGRIVELASGASEWATATGRSTNATGQFEIADERSQIGRAHV